VAGVALAAAELLSAADGRQLHLSWSGDRLGTAGIPYCVGVTGHLLRVRLLAVAAIPAFQAVALGNRLAVTGGGILNSSPALAQYSGTALYAATTYAAVFALAPRTRPGFAAAIAVLFCWLVEFFQLTGVPARLSDHSTLARLALGRTFDPSDLLWYVAGIVPLALLHRSLTRRPPE
jgi:hypothetical protein